MGNVGLLWRFHIDLSATLYFVVRIFYDDRDVFWNEQEFRWRSTALNPCGEPGLDFTISSGAFHFY
jgi:hypothetical protein